MGVFCKSDQSSVDRSRDFSLPGDDGALIDEICPVILKEQGILCKPYGGLQVSLAGPAQIGYNDPALDPRDFFAM